MVAVGILFALEAAMFLFVWKTNKRMSKFFNGSGGKSIEKILEYEFKRMEKNEGDIRHLIENMKWIEGVARKSISKTSIKRFNPFKGIGGNQSFSIAFLDNKNDGVVLSSLYSSEGTKIYAKAVENGISEHQLTDEEKEVLSKAAELN